MYTNAQIISDLQEKINSHQPVDFLSDWKGVPVSVPGYIQEVRNESVVFQVDGPDSVVFAYEDYILILNNAFIMGIKGKILAFDPHNGLVEIGDFTYVDRGFGYRSMVRVEPNEPFSGTLLSDEAILPCEVIDFSLNGFGLLVTSTDQLELSKAQEITIKFILLDQEIQITGSLVNLFPKGNKIRLAMSFAQDTPHHATITRYIAQRRAEIRQEILDAYQQAIGHPV